MTQEDLRNEFEIKFNQQAILESNDPQFPKDKPYPVNNPRFTAWVMDELIEARKKSVKWNKLEEAISPFYDEDDPKSNTEDGLCEIGEIAATHLGYL